MHSVEIDESRDTSPSSLVCKGLQDVKELMWPAYHNSL
jgi:hypothetical protein